MLKKILLSIIATGLAAGCLQAKSIGEFIKNPSLKNPFRHKLDLSAKGIDSAAGFERLVAKYPNLKRLRLDINYLTSLPAEIGKLTNLTELDLDNNELTSLPAEIGKLTNLTRLDLLDNKLASLPKEIGKLTKLTMLDLRVNQLGSLPAAIGQLTELTWLDLAYNKLTSLPAELGELTKLRKLELDRNQLTLEEIKRIKDLLPNTAISAANQKVLKANLMRRSPRGLRRRRAQRSV